MKLRILVWIFAAVLIPLSTLSAGDGHMMAPYTGSMVFEKLKTLAGTWEGSSSMGKEGEVVTVKYYVTSNGSALVETLFPGTSGEMLSVFYDEGEKVVMTHYCSMANQPRLELSKAQGETLRFRFARENKIDPRKDTHMHSLTLTFMTPNQIQQDWTGYEKGKAMHTNTLALTRVTVAATEQAK